MKKVEEIKLRRQNTHVMQRLRKAHELEVTKDVREVQRDLSLVRSPAAKAPAKKSQAVVEEIHESDVEMEEEPPMLVEVH